MQAKIDLALRNERYIFTGTHAYEIPAYKPNDIDICIECRDSGLHYSEICHAIRTIGAEEVGAYQDCFSGEGQTFGRFKLENFDLFIVDRNTFKKIALATEVLKGQPYIAKEMMINRSFRIELFQLFVRNIKV